jgi:hypothetical protein
MKNICVILNLLLFLFIGASCDKEWEISPSSRTNIIEKEIDSIGFKFCLLDESGEASTVFNEGENFSFYFSVTNKTGRKLYFNPEYAYSDKNGFCTIYTTTNNNVGIPYVFKGQDLTGANGDPFEPNESRIFIQLWKDDHDSIWRWESGYYESTHQEHLTKGTYFTEFKHPFKFKGEPTIETGEIGFKIKFKIQ